MMTFILLLYKSYPQPDLGSTTLAKKILDQALNILRGFILFLNKRHPREMGTAEIQAFLLHLAHECNVSASTKTRL